MWKLLELEEECFMYRCKEFDNNFQFILFQIKECLSETLNFSEVFQRAKKLNRRIIVDERTLRETLLEKNVIKAVRKEGDVFALEYRIQNCPFYFEWNMHRQTEIEARTTIIYPLIEMSEIMYQKITKLCEYLQEKDNEIEQYKAEGAVLVRRTVATERFDIERFEKCFYKISHSCLCLNKIAKQENEYKATRNLKNFINNTETQQANEITPEKRRKRRGHRSPHRKMTLRNFNNEKSSSKRLAYLESESQNHSDDPLFLPKESQSRKSNNAKKIEEKKTPRCSTTVTKVEVADKNSEVLPSTVDKTKSVAKRKLKSTTDMDMTQKEAKYDPKAEIIKIPNTISPRKSLRSETMSIENQAIKTPPKIKDIQQKDATDDNNEFDMNDLFTWKKISNEPKIDESKSVAQILQGLKDLESHRTGKN